MACSSYTRSGLLLFFGTLLLTSSVLFVLLWPGLYFDQLKKQLILTETSQSFKLWRETPMPMYLELFLFHCTNSEEVLKDPDNVIPAFEEKGPYVFREIHEKVNITWNTNHTVSFYNKRTWHFEPSFTNGSLSDNITNINVVVAAATYGTRFRVGLLKLFIDAFLRRFHESLFVTKTARELLFDGYDDPVLDFVHNNNIPGFNIPYKKFGWFVERNESVTYDGSFNMFTGTNNIDDLGIVEKWKGVNHTDIYPGQCGDVRGTTGELGPPMFTEKEVTVFASDLCTYVSLVREENISVQGIDGVRFVANESVFDNGYNYPERACFCDEHRDSNCVPSGALNVSKCRLGAPAFVSFPHFYLADPSYSQKVQGLSPNKEQHEFRVTLADVMGVPLQVRAQLQINMLIRRIDNYSILDSMPVETFVPMLWFRQEIVISDDYAALARFALMVRKAVPYALYATSALAMGLLMAGVVVLFKHLFFTQEVETQQLVTEEQ